MTKIRPSPSCPAEPSDALLLIPYRTDYLFRFFGMLSRKKPLVAGLLYFLISYAATYLIGWLTGQLHGKNGLQPMWTQVVDNINLAVLAPCGAALLCHLYNAIGEAFEHLKRDQVVPSSQHAEYTAFLQRLDRLYNHRGVVVVALAGSIAINVFNYLQKQNSWLGINGGITGLYGRFFIIINFFLIILIVYKCAITVWGLNRLFRFDIQVQPMHPDRAGGLREIGRLAIAVNYFIGLIITFFTLLIIFDPYARDHLIFPLLMGIFYLLSPVLLIGSLARANRVMTQRKKEALHRLGVTFDFYYRKLSEGSRDTPYAIDAADEIIKIQGLYEIVDAMPVWPFDLRSIARFVSTIGIPLVAFFVDVCIKYFGAGSVPELLMKLFQR